MMLNVKNKNYNGIFKDFEDLDVTTGASNDLIQANKIARDYITKYGFGDNIIIMIHQQ